MSAGSRHANTTHEGLLLWNSAQRGRADEIQATLQQMQQQRVYLSSSSLALALHVAVCNDHASAVMVLLDAGGTHLVQQPGQCARTLLHHAAHYGSGDAASLLVAAKADVNTVDFCGTPAFMAARNGHAEVFQLLLHAKADVNEVRTYDGSTPTCIAAYYGHVEVVQVLVQAKADVDKASTDGATPTFVAAENGHVGVIQLLAQAKADVDKARPGGVSPTIIAAYNDHVAVIDVLAQVKADVNKATFEGTTATFIAAKIGNVNVLQLLLQARADATLSKYCCGWSPLFIAAVTGNFGAARTLLKCAPSLLAVTSTAATRCQGRDLKAGLTPLDAAREFQHNDVVQLFMQHVVAGER